nr:unnamed protein product [Callosobruchus analis]
MSSTTTISFLEEEQGAEAMEVDEANEEEMDVQEEESHDLIPTVDDPIELKKCRYHIITVFNNPEVKIDKLPNYVHFDKPSTYELYYKAYRELFGNKGPKIIYCKQRRIEVVDLAEIEDVIQTHHEGKNNHRGIKATIMQLKRNYYFDNMQKLVTDYINKCEVCDQGKYDRQPPNPPITLTETASAPFEIVHADTFYIGNQSYITLVDAFSKLAQAYPAPSQHGIISIKAFIQYFRHYGTPKLIIMDQVREFHSNALKEFLGAQKVQIHFTTVGNHESNGMIERVHSTLTEQMRILKLRHPNENVDDLLDLDSL